MNLLASQSDREVCGIGGELATCGFRGGGDFLFCSSDNFARIVLGRGFNPRFFGRAFFLGGVAHHANLAIQFHQARFDIGQPTACLFAGLLGLLHCFLDRGATIARPSWQVLTAKPDHYTRNHDKIQYDARPVSLLQIQSRDPRDGAERRRSA